MPAVDKWQQVVKKLEEETAAGRLQWEIARDVHRPDCDGPFFVTDVNGKRIAAYEFDYKNWYDDENYEWNKDVRIEFVDKDGKPEWELPKSRHRWALLENLKYRFSGADEFASQFLKGQA